MLQRLGGTDSARRPAILIVSPFEGDHALLRAYFGQFDIEVYGSVDMEDALCLVHRRNLAVIVCEHEFGHDDGWKQLLRALESLDAPPRLIVASRLAHGALWGEVLNLGGYDVLAKPFDEEEVLHVLRRVFRGRIDNTDKPAIGEPCVAVPTQTLPDDTCVAVTNLEPKFASVCQGAEE